MTDNLIAVIVKKIIDKQLATEAQLQGCSEHEIQQIIQQQNVSSLPTIYKQFLLTVGKNAGNLWYRTGYTCDILGELKADAIRLLARDGNPIILPEDAFVFHMQEGIIFYYFCVGNDDPPVFVYSEIEYTHEQVDEKLSDYLLNIW